MDAQVNPFPSELTTPPVTNMYFDIGSIVHDGWQGCNRKIAISTTCDTMGISQCNKSRMSHTINVADLADQDDRLFGHTHPDLISSSETSKS